MIRVIFYLNGNEPVGFNISGHAGYAEHGNDIVCSAVSALAQTILLALIELSGCETEHTINNNGELYCMVKPTASQSKRHDAKLLINTLRLGLNNIKNNYGKYLSIEEEVTTRCST